MLCSRRFHHAMDRHLGNHLVWRKLLRREDLRLFAGHLADAGLQRQRQIVLRTRDGRVDGRRVGQREALVVPRADRRVMLRVVMVRAHRGVSMIRRVGVAIRMSVVGRDAVRRLNIGHDGVLGGVEQALVQAVAHLVVLLHRMVVVVEARHLHHPDAVVVLRVDVEMLAEPVGVVVNPVAVHGEPDDEEQQENDADDGQDGGVGRRKEIVVHDGVDDDVAVTVAVRTEHSVVA